MSDHTIATILAATDFSEASRVAVAQAADTARTLAAKLVLLHVDTGHEAAPNDALAAVAHGITDLAVESIVRKGHADETIVSVAEQVGADLIVTGTHGRTGLKRFLLGSIAEKVVRASPTNTLVTRPHDGGLFENILVPTDFSDPAQRALHLAMLLAAPGATIDLFHAWQFPPGTKSVSVGLPNDEQSPLASLQREIEGAAVERGASWVERHASSDLTLKFSHGYGPAAQTVQDRLDQGDYDLVATGTHGRRGFRRFVLGSVAEATVRHSPCSVLVAHAGD